MTPPTTARDLGIYVLPGRTTDPASGLDEAREAERAGFGAVYVSERLDLKEAAVTCGGVVAVTTHVAVGTALIHQGTRHPLTIAALSATLQTMSGGRFVLGIGRGLGALAPSLGVPRSTLASMEHLVRTLRRLWAGDRITEIGPAGQFRGMRFADLPQSAPPVLLGTIGPRGLELAGREFDGVILHPFLTTEAVNRSVTIVRNSAERAGRDPSSLRVITTLVASPSMPSDRTEVAVRSRAVSYFQVRGLGEQIVEWNRWDPAVLDALRNHPTLSGHRIADTSLTREGLVAASECLPDEWFEAAAAVGTAELCVERGRQYLAAGADEVLVHGASPAEAAAMVPLWTLQP